MTPSYYFIKKTYFLKFQPAAPLYSICPWEPAVREQKPSLDLLIRTRLPHPDWPVGHRRSCPAPAWEGMFYSCLTAATLISTSGATCGFRCSLIKCWAYLYKEKARNNPFQTRKPRTSNLPTNANNITVELLVVYFGKIINAH